MIKNYPGGEGKIVLRAEKTILTKALKSGRREELRGIAKSLG